LLPSQSLYLSKFDGRSFGNKLSDISQFNTSFKEQHDEFIDAYFQHDKLNWNSLSNTWTYREFLALNIRPYQKTSIMGGIDLTKEHYMLNCFDLFTNLDNIIDHLFMFLGVSIDTTRKETWLEIYRQWQRTHCDRMLFCNYFDQIIDSIVNNYYMDLTRFNLDILRESVIQHVLIYKHGLTLKSWGLDKFPTNTQDLHSLLEPNIYHQVDDIYNVLK
jgi:hypothetical protein